MPYQLMLSEPEFIEEKTGSKVVGENVFLDNLPIDSEVYLLYYPGAMLNKDLESKLRTFGENTGKNLFVNIARLNDPNYKKIAKKFDIRDLPVIIVTAIDKLASPPTQFFTAFIRLDSKKLLNNPDLTIDCVQKLFNLFIQEKIAEALKQPRRYERDALIFHLESIISNALKGVEFSISLLEGKFEVKWRGG